MGEREYPNLRFAFSPEFAGANGGADVAYMFAETVDDGSTATSAVLSVGPGEIPAVGSEK